MPVAVILGCGYTGTRVAARLLARGIPVVATARDAASLQHLAALGATAFAFDATADRVPEMQIEAGALVLHSIPTLDTPAGPVDRTADILACLTPKPARVVYLSTTGVYGRTRDVDETTPVNPQTAREYLRVDAERAVANGPWSSMMLRPAAIYGPGRGIHVSMGRGDYKLAGDGLNFVSRIHVDDLAAHCEAALFSEVHGAWPIGDDHPCTSREIAEYCAQLLNLPVPASVPLDALHETRRGDRRVDGRAVRRVLGLSLRYPSYREGIPASMNFAGYSHG